MKGEIIQKGFKDLSSKYYLCCSYFSCAMRKDRKMTRLTEYCQTLREIKMLTTMPLKIHVLFGVNTVFPTFQRQRCPSKRSHLFTEWLCNATVELNRIENCFVYITLLKFFIRGVFCTYVTQNVVEFACNAPVEGLVDWVMITVWLFFQNVKF